MRKLTFILLATLIGTTALCSEPGETWVQTDNGLTQCEKVAIHKGYLTLSCTDGKQEKIPLNEVTSYSKNGKVFIKQSIYIQKYQKGNQKDEVFMTLVASKDGMDLLKYIGSKGTREFVFKGNQLIQELNSSNHKDFYEFFGI